MKVKRLHTGQMEVNTYYVLDEATNTGFIVDPGGYDASLTKLIKENNVTIPYIILTHGHHDHTGGVNAFMKQFPDAELVASKYEKEMLADANANFSKYFGQPLSFEADVYVDDGDVLNVGELELKFYHTPGHTPGGMCIHVNNCLFSGDTLFRQSIGRTDFPGSSFAQLKKAIHEKLFVLPEDTRVLPGHMDETEIGLEKRKNPFV